MKPIHKFNGGIGATLCHKCSKIITEGFTEDLYCDEHGGRQYEHTLKRIEDGKVLNARSVNWIKWGKDGRGKRMYKTPKVGYSLVLDLNSFGNFKWLTTALAEILEKKPGYIKFKTKNSTYELKTQKCKVA